MVVEGDQTGDRVETLAARMAGEAPVVVEGDQTGERVETLVVRLVVEVLEEEEYLLQEKRGRVPVQIPLALKGANLFLLVLGL